MKGVVVKVGQPKSIVLFNNGKIGAIPTPANCYAGMLVTVKFNGILKIMIISLAALLLIGLGVFIGARYFGSRTAEGRPAIEFWHGRHGRRRW